LPRVRKIGEVLQDKRLGRLVVGADYWKGELEKRGVVGSGHLGLDTAVKSDAKGAWLRGYAVVAEAAKGSAGLLGKGATVNVSAWAVRVSEQGEVPQTGTAARPAVVHRAEASHRGAVQSKATLPAITGGVGNCLGHAVRQRSTWEHIPAVGGTD
jgi:hypothetical protein